MDTDLEQMIQDIMDKADRNVEQRSRLFRQIGDEMDSRERRGDYGTFFMVNLPFPDVPEL